MPAPRWWTASSRRESLARSESLKRGRLLDLGSHLARCIPCHLRPMAHRPKNSPTPEAPSVARSTTPPCCSRAARRLVQQATKRQRSHTVDRSANATYPVPLQCPASQPPLALSARLQEPETSVSLAFERSNAPSGSHGSPRDAPRATRLGNGKAFASSSLRSGFPAIPGRATSRTGTGSRCDLARSVRRRAGLRVIPGPSRVIAAATRPTCTG